jgi:hypothetical protein
MTELRGERVDYTEIKDDLLKLKSGDPNISYFVKS